MQRVSILLITVALIAGMVGCVGGDGNNGDGPYTLIVDFTAGGTVAVDDVPIPGKAILPYDAGTVVSLNATPSAGYRFVEWTGNVSNVADIEDASTTVTMNGDYSIMANFVAVYDLTVSSTAGGSVTTPAEGTFTYNAGTVVNLVATPASCHDFVNWTGNVGTIANVNTASTTITMNGDYEITANFGEEGAVTFPDSNLEAAVREAIGKPTGHICPSDLKGLTSLSVNNKNIGDLTGLEYATSLTFLSLYGNQISDISPLANLTHLTSLNIGNNGISNISPLEGLSGLTGLHAHYNQIDDISPLTNLTNLTFLHLIGNQISDVSPLASLTSLTVLSLHDNQIGDISPIANLTSLTELYAANNQITDISPLASLTNLTSLQIMLNQISDVSPLANLTKLTFLSLEHNQISDISPLTNLMNLTTLWIWDNSISDISPLASLSSLTDIILDGNQISDISPLANLTNLTSLCLGYNQISDIGPLVQNVGLSMGDTLYLSGNPLSSDSINIYIPQLEARGVTVYY